MRIDMITLFPEMFAGPFGASITKRAVEKGILDIHFTNFRDYSFDKHRHVDDSPFGGGAGMVMLPFSLPLTWTAISTVEATVLLSS